MKQIFQVPVIIHIRHTIEVEIETTDETGYSDDRDNRNKAATAALYQVSRWDWKEEQLGDHDGASIEIAQPVKMY
jgi:hypothetical protein